MSSREQEIEHRMYARSFKRAADTRRFTITDAGASGWKVREEENSRVVREVWYDDWHRVERARLNIALAGRELADAGWTEV